MATPWDGQWWRQIQSSPSSTSFAAYQKYIVQLPGFSEVQLKVRDISVKEDDVWIVSFPGSGGNMMQELVWLLTHNLDYEGSTVPLKLRTASLDSAFTRYFLGKEGPPSLSEFEKIREQLVGRRIMKTHLHWLLLPDELTRPGGTGKTIYVARNPKDICVSYYDKHRSYAKFREDNILFDDFAQAFVSDKVFCSPYWPHLKEFWNRRYDPNVLLIKYEDMANNLEDVVRNVAEYLDVSPLSDDQMKKLINHLKVENLAKKPLTNSQEGEATSSDTEGDQENSKFMAEVKVGSWKKRMSPELTQKFNHWIRRNTLKTDIIFLEQ